MIALGLRIFECAPSQLSLLLLHRRTSRRRGGSTSARLRSGMRCMQGGSWAHTIITRHLRLSPGSMKRCEEYLTCSRAPSSISIGICDSGVASPTPCFYVLLYAIASAVVWKCAELVHSALRRYAFHRKSMFSSSIVLFRVRRRRISRKLGYCRYQQANNS
jgi:hypothetical protein